MASLRLGLVVEDEALSFHVHYLTTVKDDKDLLLSSILRYELCNYTQGALLVCCTKMKGLRSFVMCAQICEHAQN